MNEVKKFLEHKAYLMRLSSLLCTSMAGSGHPTSSLSAADIVAALFFYAMHYDPHNPDNPNNDRFILSKGHASPILYAVYKELGIISDQELLGYRTYDSVLEGHPTCRFSYTEAATGSLGNGLAIGVGMALSAQLTNKKYTTYVLLGDGETAEGSVWEAAELAHYYRLHNLVAIIDVNRLGQTGETMHEHHVHRYEEKFQAFGWKPILIDGHNMQQIINALATTKEDHEWPIVIIAKTIKGYGLKEIENKNNFHGKAFSKEQLNELFKQLEERFESAATYDGNYTYQPQLPKPAQSVPPDTPIMLPAPIYHMNDQIATRKAFGNALVALGSACKEIICLDAEVSNSTYTQLFKEKFPNRFIECFIAEQAMVNMAIGIERRNLIPFAATFGAFFSRAHDQIRMAAIGTTPLRLVGSHAGVSIGQDGPSQMALEDIAIMRALPNSTVLYPCDAISTHYLVQEMANYTQGISYLRTTRAETPILYEAHHNFTIGGCSVLKESDADVACVVAAGITVFEALKAYDMLQQKGIAIAIIDLYSIKPMDTSTLTRIATKAAHTIITVEDHYLEGGLGQAVSCALQNNRFSITNLAVTELPRSGSKEDLMRHAGIDAQAIVDAIIQQKTTSNLPL